MTKEDNDFINIKQNNQITAAQFNKHFTCKDKNIINEILEVKDGIKQHPFIQNRKGYCRICRSRTKDDHINIEIIDFFHRNKIKYKKAKNLKEKLAQDMIKSDNNIIETIDNNIILNTDYISRRTTPNDNQIIFIESSPIINTDLSFSPRKSKNINTKLSARKDELSTFYHTFMPMTNKQNVKESTHNDSISKLDIVKRKSDYCDICFSDIKDKFTLICGHFYCRDCVSEHIKNSVYNIPYFKNLKCPKAICNVKIKEKTIEKIFTETEFDKYLKLKTKIEALGNPMNLACPYPDCESYGVKSNNKKGIVKCITALHKFCIRCQKPAHLGKACIGDKEEKLLMIANHKMIKRCPNCRCWLEKSEDACNNVTCINIYCNYSFCWICEKLYEKNHYSNPLSPCFGLAEVNNNGLLTTNKCVRNMKCLLMLILLLILLPFVILLFSFIVVTFYILTFVLDGSAVKNVKFKTERRDKVFRFIVSAIYITMSFPMISLGYIFLSLFLAFAPIIYAFKKCCKKTNDGEVRD